MIRIELMVHDLIQLAENLRNNKDRVDVINELHLCQKKIEEYENELTEMDAIIDSSKISIKCSEKRNVLKRIGELVIQSNIQFSLLEEADKLINDGTMFQKTSEPISNKVARIMIMLERYHEQLNEIRKCVDESDIPFDNSRDIVFKIQEIIIKSKRNKVNKDLSTKSGLKTFIMNLVNDFNVLSANSISMDDKKHFENFLEEKLCK